MKTFNGNILFLDRSDINTDEIIPAKYLTEISKQALKPHLLEELTLEGFYPARDIKNKQVVVTRANFGCGSSREHAPWAFEINGINLVIAESYARIFKQNMFNCGMMAVELAKETIDHIFSTCKGEHARIGMDFQKMVFMLTGRSHTEEIPFSISNFERALVQAGGWMEYADSHY